jgi:2-keto-3-deoxy-6-phosphogluconate aldolase
MSRQMVLSTLEQTRLLAILRGDFKGRELDLVDYCYCIANIAKCFGGRLHTGAGTALTDQHVKEAAVVAATKKHELGSELVSGSETQTADWEKLRKRATEFAQAAKRTHRD